MGFDYTGIVATALRLIEKFGRSTTLRRVTEGTYDTATLTVSGASNTDETVTIAILDYSKREIDGEIVQRGDRLGLLAASGITAPDLNDQVIDGTVNFSIKNIEIVQPGDTVILYKLQLRK